MILITILGVVLFYTLCIYYLDAIMKLTVSEDYDTKKDLLNAMIPFYNWYKKITDDYNNLSS
tara:strand:- start:12110 stop:12295 length:186 start_codon:yes stop_codon:yes gene_type:complete